VGDDPAEAHRAAPGSLDSPPSTERPAEALANCGLLSQGGLDRPVLPAEGCWHSFQKWWQRQGHVTSHPQAASLPRAPQVRVPTAITQESHAGNGTVRYICYAG
jgi:hypothetical protein